MYTKKNKNDALSLFERSRKKLRGALRRSGCPPAMMEVAMTDIASAIAMYESDRARPPSRPKRRRQELKSVATSAEALRAHLEKIDPHSNFWELPTACGMTRDLTVLIHECEKALLKIPKDRGGARRDAALEDFLVGLGAYRAKWCQDSNDVSRSGSAKEYEKEPYNGPLLDFVQDVFVALRIDFTSRAALGEHLHVPPKQRRQHEKYLRLWEEEPRRKPAR